LAVAPALFVEYVEALHGRHMFQWSAGLAVAVGLADERSDQEVAEGIDQADPILVELEGAEWAAVRRSGGIVRLLEIADVGDAAAVRAFVVICTLVPLVRMRSLPRVGNGGFCQIESSG
jgi:hypothetical protein